MNRRSDGALSVGVGSWNSWHCVSCCGLLHDISALSSLFAGVPVSARLVTGGAEVYGKG